MDFLLDTHTFLWFIEGSGELPAGRRADISNRSNKIFISIISFWELGIKLSNKKLRTFYSMEQMYRFAHQQAIILPTINDVIAISEMPLHHRDPFDRMLIAQAINRKLIVISKDKAFDAYDVKRLW